MYSATAFEDGGTRICYCMVYNGLGEFWLWTSVQYKCRLSVRLNEVNTQWNGTEPEVIDAQYRHEEVGKMKRYKKNEKG